MDKRTRWLCAGILLVAIIFGGALRLDGFHSRVFYGDETHSLRFYSRSWTELFQTYNNGGSGIALPLLQKVCAQTFGANEMTLRLPGLIPGLLAIPLSFFFFRFFFNPLPASLATLLFALSHWAIYYAMNGRIYSLSLFLAMLAAMVVMRITEQPRRWHWPCLSLFFAVAVYCHVVNAVLLVVWPAYLLAFLIRQRAPRRQFFAWGAMGLAAGLLAFLLYLPAWDEAVSFISQKAAKTRGIDPSWLAAHPLGRVRQ